MCIKNEKTIQKSEKHGLLTLNWSTRTVILKGASSGPAATGIAAVTADTAVATIAAAVTCCCCGHGNSN